MNTQALQNAVDAIDAHSWNLDDKGLVIAAKCRGLMAGYHARYANAGLMPVAVEEVYQTPLTNPDTGRNSRSFTVAGMIDVLCEVDGSTILLDHKTCSQEIADPAAPYWRQLTVEGQVSHYMLMLWQHGIKCDKAIWDVMRKPNIKPKKLSKADMAMVASTREYFDAPIMLQDPQTWDGRERFDMFESRVAHDCTYERPDWYFQRRTVARMDNELFEYARELWQHSQDLLHDRGELKERSKKLNQKVDPVRNSGACMLYGSACKFLGICSGYDSIDSDKWVDKKHIHNELPEIDEGLDVLTNSRIRCFQTCRRKHYYEYELARERVDEEEKEALFFGNLWHHAQEAWWKTFLVQGETDGNSK